MYTKYYLLVIYHVLNFVMINKGCLVFQTMPGFLSFVDIGLFIVNSFTLQDTYFLDKLNRGLSTRNSLISNNSMQTSLTGVFLPLFYSFAISELSEFMFSFYSFSPDYRCTINLNLSQSVIYTEIYPYFLISVCCAVTDTFPWI